MKKVGGRDHWYGTCFFVPPRGKMLLTQGLAGSMVSSILHELKQDNSVKQIAHQNHYSLLKSSTAPRRNSLSEYQHKNLVLQFCAFLDSCRHGASIP